jgi:hypothetical protein
LFAARQPPHHLWSGAGCGVGQVVAKWIKLPRKWLSPAGWWGRRMADADAQSRTYPNTISVRWSAARDSSRTGLSTRWEHTLTALVGGSTEIAPRIGVGHFSAAQSCGLLTLASVQAPASRAHLELVSRSDMTEVGLNGKLVAFSIHDVNQNSQHRRKRSLPCLS